MILFGSHGADQWNVSAGAWEKLVNLIDIPKATVVCRSLGEGHMGPYLDAIARSLRDDSYKGVISLESVYRPEGGSFEDGFRSSVTKFKSLFG